MSLSLQITEIRKQLQNGRFSNEAAVCQGVLLPILNSLGWPVFDTTIVFPQFPLENRRVDYALCGSSARPCAFVEVKGVGKAEGADRQLFEYAFHKGVPFAILTDGREWHFYLPAEEGEYQERRVYKLDIIERDSEDAAKYFERYLKYQRVLSGEALKAARSDYQDVSRSIKIATTMPIAWARLLQERDEVLLELFAEKVEDLCGFKPELHACNDFIGGLSAKAQIRDIRQSEPPPVPANHFTSPEPDHSSPTPLGQGQSYTLAQLANMPLVNRKPSFLQLSDQRINTKTWSELCVKLVGWLVDQGHLKHNHLPIYNAAGKHKYFINFRPEHEATGKDGYWRQVHDVFIDVKYSAPHHVSNIIHTLQHLNLRELEVRIALSNER
jgi:hypothetical protein